MQLFRKEALAAKRHQLAGDLMITQSAPLWWSATVLSVLVGSAVAYAATGTYARSYTVPGTIIPEKGIITLVASRAGRLDTLDLKVGDHVARNDQVARLSGEVVASDGSASLAAQLAENKLQVSTLEDQLLAERARANRMHKSLVGTRTDLLAERSALLAQVEAQNNIVTLAKKAVDQFKQLSDKGFGAEAELANRRSNYLNQKRSHAALKQQVASMDARLKTLQREIQDVLPNRDGRIAEINAQLSNLRSRAQELKANRSAALVSPTAGRVTSVTALEGNLIQVGQSIAKILPENSGLEVRLYVPTRAAGFLKEGQEVKLQYDAFPYQRFGAYGGTIRQVGGSILSPNDLNAQVPLQEPFYDVRVTLDKESINAFGKEQVLQPGMTLSANIIVERQSFLEWLLEPLYAVTRRG